MRIVQTPVKFILPLALLCHSVALAGLVSDVEKTLAQNNVRGALQQIQTARARQGETPQTILALSWVARASLERRQFAEADGYARDTYQRALAQLKKRPLDVEPDLPTALGAAIEVEAIGMVAQGARSEAVSFLTDELRKFSGTSIQTRIQKNINLLTLEGKSAPTVRGVSLPVGKPALLFFWAHWCGDCRAEAPILARLKAEYASKGLAFIGPTQKYGYVAGGREAPPAVETAYIEQIRKQYYAAVVDAPATINEDNFKNYGVSTTPTLALVDRHGVVRRYHPGGMTYAELKTAIEGVLRIP
jgi:thiol-disulfide isomerase/thioredoxin